MIELKSELAKLNHDETLRSNNVSQIVPNRSLNKTKQYDKFNLITFKNRKCSYLDYGNVEIHQPVFYCQMCDPSQNEPMCLDCYEDCHKPCQKVPANPDEEQKTFVFVCECGKGKHDINNKINQSEMFMDKKCYLSDVDQNLKNKFIYSCNNCWTKSLCYTCYIKCHKMCKSRRKNIPDDYEYNKTDYRRTCECTHNNHTNLITLNSLILTLTSPTTFSYESIPFVWQIQILNSFFQSEHLPKAFFTPIDNFFRNYIEETEIKKLDSNFSYVTIVLSKNISNAALYYYYHPKIIDMLPLNKIISLLHKFKDKDLIENSNLICALLMIVLFVHLKKDFQDFKNLCVFDFLVSNPLERIIMRKFLFTESIYTHAIHKKYFNSDKHKFILPKLSIFLAKLLLKAWNIFSDQSKCIKIYFICIRIIFYNLKRMLFDLKQLIKLINVLDPFYSSFHGFLMKYIKNLGDKKPSDDMFRVICYLSKIIYLITILYNDLIISDLINNKAKHQEFIHTTTTHGNKLFKMVLNCSGVFSIVLIKQNMSEYTEYLNLLNETIKMFSLSDNTFYRSITNIDKHTFLQFSEHVKTMTGIPQFEVNNNISRCDDRMELIINECEKNPEILLKKYIFHIKMIVEQSLIDFFNYKISLNELFENIESIEGIQTKGMMNTENKREIKKSSLSEYKDKIINKSYIKVRENDGDIEKLLIKELIFSNLDISLTKLFVIDFQLKNYSSKTVDFIFSLLSLYCLSKQGLSYFCIGRNFRRILKIFDKFPRKTLEFLHIIFKGIRLHNIDISMHKRLPAIMLKLHSYVRDFRVTNDKEEIDFKGVLTYIIKILLSVSKYFDLEELTSIKKDIFNAVYEKNLLDKDKIAKLFPLQNNSNDDEEGGGDISCFDLNKVREVFERETRVNKNRMPAKKGKYQSPVKSYRNKDYLKEDTSAILPSSKVPLMDLEDNEPITIDPTICKQSPQLSFSTDFKFFFSFIKIMSDFTYFLPKDDNLFTSINQMNDMSTYKTLLNKNYLPIKHRITLLTFLTKFYLVDILEDNTYEKIDKYPSSEEFILFNKQHPSDRDKRILDKYHVKLKVEHLSCVLSIIDILVQELKNFLLFIYLEQNHIEDINTYLKLLIFSCRFISDLFITNKVANYATLYFYELTKEFLKKVNTFRNYLISIHKQNKIDQLEVHDLPSSNITIMESNEFDIFDTQQIYTFALQGFQDIFQYTHINRNTGLQKFLHLNILNNELNYKSFCLNTETPYKSLLSDYNCKDDEEIIQKDLHYTHFKQILRVYLNQFLNFPKTTLINVIDTNSHDIVAEYRNIFFDCCLSYVFGNDNKLYNQYMPSMLQILTRLLFYQENKTQIAIWDSLSKENTQLFFYRFTNKLQKILNTNLVIVKNSFAINRYQNTDQLIRRMIKFIQLLNDTPTRNFCDLIITDIAINTETTTNNIVAPSVIVFKVLIDGLCNALQSINLGTYFTSEMPYDKLILTISSLISCLEDHLQGSNQKSFEIMYEYIIPNFNLFKQFIFQEYDNSNYTTFRSQILYELKMEIIRLMIYLIEESYSRSLSITAIVKTIHPTDLFDQIQNNIISLIEHMKKSKKIQSSVSLQDNSIVDKMITLYTYDEDFQSSNQLNLSLKIFYLLQILSDFYNNRQVKNLFEELQNNTMSQSKYACNIYIFLNKLMKKIEIRDPSTSNKKDFAFFVIPPICFLLSAQTISSFWHNVDRDSVDSKISSLISETDYFIYEMFFNRRLMKSINGITKYIFNINLFQCELINYFIILLHQTLLLYHFYTPNHQRIYDSQKYLIYTDGYSLCAIQLLYLFIILTIWFKYKFTLYFQHKLMTIYHNHFIFKKQGSEDKDIQRYLSNNQDTSENPIETLIDQLNCEVSFWNKAKICIVDTILLNREINMFVFTFICIILFFITHSNICMVIPVLFAVNLSSILYGIVLAIKLRWIQLFTVLYFTYVIVYLFAWISFYYLQDSFVFADPIISTSVLIIFNF